MINARARRPGWSVGCLPGDLVRGIRGRGRRAVRPWGARAIAGACRRRSRGRRPPTRRHGPGRGRAPRRPSARSRALCHAASSGSPPPQRPGRPQGPRRQRGDFPHAALLDLLGVGLQHEPPEVRVIQAHRRDGGRTEAVAGTRPGPGTPAKTGRGSRRRPATRVLSRFGVGERGGRSGVGGVPARQGGLSASGRSGDGRVTEDHDARPARRAYRRPRRNDDVHGSREPGRGRGLAGPAAVHAPGEELPLVLRPAVSATVERPVPTSIDWPPKQ